MQSFLMRSAYMKETIIAFNSSSCEYECDIENSCDFISFEETSKKCYKHSVCQYGCPLEQKNLEFEYYPKDLNQSLTEEFFQIHSNTRLFKASSSRITLSQTTEEICGLECNALNSYWMCHFYYMIGDSCVLGT